MMRMYQHEGLTNRKWLKTVKTREPVITVRVNHMKKSSKNGRR